MAKKKGTLPKSVEREVRKRWEPVERPGIEKWKKGRVAIGIYEGTREAGKGYLCDLKESDGLHTYSCPTVLRDILRSVQVSDEIRITCTGTQPSKHPQPTWLFDVEVAVDEA